MQKSRWKRWKKFAHLAACATAVFVASSAHAQYGGPVLTPPGLVFPAVAVGGTSAPQSLTVTSPVGETIFPLNSISLPSGFSRSGGTCPTPPGSANNGCTIGVVFAPTANGSAGGSMVVNASAFGFPQDTTIPLNGTGVTSLDLSVSISDSPDPVIANDTVTYSVVVNKGPGTTAPSDIEVLLTSSNGLLFPPTTSSPGWNCTAQSFPNTKCIYTVSTSASTLPTLQVSAQAFAGVGTVSLTANEGFGPSASFIDPSGPSNVTETTTVQEQADLTFVSGSVTIAPGTVNVGETATINATPRNNGPSFPDIVVTMTLPPQVTAVLPVPSNFFYTCSFVSPVITCVTATGNTPNRGGPSPLPAIQVQALTASATPVNIPISISSSVTDPVPGNNTVVLPLGITGPDLSPQFDDLADPVATGDQISFRGALANVGTGSSGTSGNTVTISPSPNLTYIGFSGSGWTCTADVNGNANCSYGTAIGAGSSSNLLFVDYTAPAVAASINTSFTSGTDGNLANNTDTEITTVANNDLALSGSGSPLSGLVPYNTVLTLVPTYSGAGPNSGTAYSIDANLPTGVALVSVDPQSQWVCNAPGSNPVSCALTPTPRGNDPGPITLPSLSLTLSKSTVGQSTIPFVLAANTGVTDPVPANNTFNYVINGTAPTADLSISKTSGVTSIPAGQPYSYTLSVSNAAASGIAAAAVQLSDTLPTGVSFQSFTAGTGSGTWSCTNVGQQFSCNLSPALPVGASAPPITLNVRYSAASLPSGGSVSNTATVSSSTTDPQPSNNNSTAVTQISASSDLTVSVVDSADPVNANQSFSYTITPRNLGPIAAGSALLELGFNLAQVDFLGTTAGSGWTCPGTAQAGTPNLTCTYSGAAVNSGLDFPTVVLNLRARALGASANHVLTAKISSSSFDAVPGNNQITESTGINPAATLTLEKTDDVDPVNVNSLVSYALTVRNQGPGSASNLVVIDTLPSGLQFVGTSGSGWTCSNSTQTVTCNSPGPLAVSAASTVNIQARALAAGVGTVTNQATVSASQTVGSASASQTTTIRARAELGLSKTASSSQASVGQIVDFTLEASNDGVDGVSGLVLLDPLPANFEFISAAGEGWSCTQTSGTIDCRRPRLERGQSSQVLISTRARTPGSSVNNATLRAIESLAPVNASAVVNIADGGVVALVASKTASQIQVASNGTLSYRLGVRNDGTAQAAGVTMVDTLPTGVLLDQIQAPSGVSCSGTTTIRCDLQQALAAGAAVEVNVSTRIQLNVGSGCQNVRNSVTVSTTSSEPVTSDNSAFVDVSVCAAGGLTRYDLQLSLSPVSFDFASQTLSFSLRNAGPGAYPGGPLSFDFGQTGMRLESFNGCTSSNQVATCVLPALPANGSISGATVRLQAVGTSSPGGQIRVRAEPVDPGDINEPDNLVVLNVNPSMVPSNSADLRLTGRALAADGLTGTAASFEFVITNLGPSSAAGVTLRVPLPAGITLGNVIGSNITCTTTGSEVSCARPLPPVTPPLGVNESATVTIAVRLPDAPGAVVLTGQVSSVVTDPVPGNNSASVTVQARLRNATEITSALGQCAALDRIAQIPVAALAQECANPASSMQPLCRALLNAASSQSCEEVRNALTEIAPKEVLAQTLLLKDFANTQFFNVDARLSELRGGAGGFSTSGLNLSLGGQSVSIGMLRDLRRALEGEEPEEPEYDTDLVSPWGFFINGSISSGDQDLNTTRYKVKTDFESRGLTAGVDYRFSSRLVGGVALGFARFDADVSERSSLDTTARSLTGYASWYATDRFYVDARLSLGKASFDLDRQVQFTVSGQAFNATALGSTDADQLTVASSMGYHYNTGGWNITPNFALRYIKSEVDGFTETGAGQFNVSYGDQSVSSSQAALGIQVSRAFSLSSGVISPQFDFSINREINSADLVLEARLVGAASGQVFELTDEDQDPTYGSVGLGFVYLTANGKQAYLSYRRIVGQEGLDRGTLNIGGRFEF